MGKEIDDMIECILSEIFDNADDKKAVLKLYKSSPFAVYIPEILKNKLATSNVSKGLIMEIHSNQEILYKFNIERCMGYFYNPIFSQYIRETLGPITQRIVDCLLNSNAETIKSIREKTSLSFGTIDRKSVV